LSLIADGTSECSIAWLWHTAPTAPLERSWQGGTVTIPNLADVSMCVTIYPLVKTLLKGGYDNELHSLMSTTKPREMLSCWHEASNIGPDGTPGKEDGDGTKIYGNVARAMQMYLYNFAKTGAGNTTPTASQIQNPFIQLRRRSG
jgi:hypothetical protein